MKIPVAVAVCLVVAGSSLASPIDREALVTRHNPIVRSVDYDSPLTVGNGGFAFSVDVTGLQTFPAEYHRNGIPLETLSRWAWVQDENPAGYKLADANRNYTHPDGTVHPYPTSSGSSAGDWLRRNPRNHPLGQIALAWKKADGTEFTSADMSDIEQTLDLWHGVIRSRFSLGGKRVEVTTACLPDEDTVALRIESDLVASGELAVKLAFPRGHDPKVKNTPAFDWSQTETHTSTLTNPQQIARRVNGFEYAVTLSRAAEAAPAVPHTFFVRGERGARVLELAVNFGTQPRANVAADFARAAAHWPKFWQRSAAADFSGSTNALAPKLERRIVLSQYLLAVQMAGDVPPQESGLTCSTWYGKHHTEMIWWHAAHFPLWGHAEMLARNVDWYRQKLPVARELAQSRGLRGARWAKMVGPDLRESPGGNPLIVWNQPHMVYLCELLYRAAPTGETLDRYGELVQETADCMASMLWLDPKRDRYVLGPPVWIVQEIYDQSKAQNPTFELAYWRWALGLAQEWRERRGLPREKSWDDVIARLSPLPVKHGKYVGIESTPDTWDNVASRHDHPSMLMALGVLPETPAVDRATMDRTLTAVLEQWDWPTKIWGWDYPMVAMTAFRLGRATEGIEFLLRDGPNNVYLPNGHAPVRSDEALPANAPPGARRREIAVYLPANGSFLAAVSLMLGGWDGANSEHPGVPRDGTWVVKAEGWKPLP
jgi:hypothetical protein